MSSESYSDAEVTLFKSLDVASAMANQGDHEDAAQIALAAVNHYHRHAGE